MQEDCKELFGTAIKTAISFFITIWSLLLICALCGCSRTHYVPVESVRTEYVRTDSVMFEKILGYMRESVRRSQSTSDTTILRITNTYTLNENGDTIKSDTNTQEYRSTSRERELEVENKTLRDSVSTLNQRLASNRSDSIERIVPVERELSRWEKAKMDFGGAALCAAGGALCALIVWLAIVKRKR